jgi:hypothetical protein
MTCNPLHRKVLLLITLGLWGSAMAAGAQVGSCCDTKQWKESTAAGPDERTDAAMAYDSARHRLVLFGGADLSPLLRGDTWEWDGNFWALKPVFGPLPSPRSGHAMAYDAARGRVVLFGGVDASGVRGDTWEWDGTTWTAKAITGPSPRADHAMVYDSGRGKVILFGGSGPNSGETWEWDGAAWTRKSTTGPGSRYFHAMADDSIHGRVVLFGGIAPGAVLSLADTWTWDGTNWASQSVPGPPGRYGHSMAFDAACGRVVLFGGIASSVGGRLGDTWQWNGASWTQLPATGPSPRTGSAMAYDSANGTIVLFGGYDSNPNYTDGTWLLSPAPSLSLTITQQPSSLALKAGQTATFSVVVSGSGPFTYRWRKNGVDLVDGGSISGAKTNKLILSPTALADAGSYDVAIGGGCQTVTSTVAALTLSPPLACDTLYAIDFAANTPGFISKLYTLDAATGAAKSTVGITGIGATIGLAFANNALYAVTTFGTSTPNSLYKINPTTGSAQLVGPLLIPGGVGEGELAFDPTGTTLYGISGSDLFTVNLATGKGALVGTVPGGLRDISYMAFDALTGSLYAIDNGPGSLSPTTLLRLNPTNAQISFSQPLSKLGGWGGMDFDPGTGLFYLADSGPAGTNKLYTLDPATGALTPRGPTNLTPGLSGVAFCRQVRTCVPPPQGLVAWYPLDEPSGRAAQDLATGNTGTYVNGPTSIPGEVALAREFNGVSNYVQAPDRPWLNPGDLSIDAWVRISNAGDTSGVRVVAEKRTLTPLRGYSLFLYRGRPGLQLADASGYSNYITFSAVPADGHWHLVAITVTRNQTNGGTWYIDGVSVGKFDPTNRQGSLTNTSPLRLGSLTLGGAGSVFKGGLDEVEIFNRALTPQEIAAIFKAGSVGECK